MYCIRRRIRIGRQLSREQQSPLLRKCCTGRPAKEPAKKPAKAEQPKSDKADGKNYLDKLAEDAAAADRYDLKLPDGAIVDEPLMRDFTKLGARARVQQRAGAALG